MSLRTTIHLRLATNNKGGKGQKESDARPERVPTSAPELIAVIPLAAGAPAPLPALPLVDVIHHVHGVPVRQLPVFDDGSPVAVVTLVVEAVEAAHARALAQQRHAHAAAVVALPVPRDGDRMPCDATESSQQTCAS